MDRRAAGAVMLIAATLIAVVIPTFSGRRLAGSGVRSPAPGPPLVGQCLVEAANGRSALPYDGVTVLAAAAGPCGPTGFGEVVFVTSDARAFPATMAFNRTSYPDPLACKGPAREYFGWAATGSVDQNSAPPDTRGALTAWSPVLTESLVLLGPDLTQFLDGQRWIACAVLPRDAPYSGSLRTGTAVGTFPPADAFGLCVTHPGTTREGPVSCGKPHEAEIFGWAPVGAADASLMSSCRALVTLTTGMIDPGARGSLRVRLSTAAPKTTGEPATGSGGAAGDRVSCLIEVVGNSRLGGGLTWIAKRPQGR